MHALGIVDTHVRFLPRAAEPRQLGGPSLGSCGQFVECPGQSHTYVPERRRIRGSALVHVQSSKAKSTRRDNRKDS